MPSATGVTTPTRLIRYSCGKAVRSTDSLKYITGVQSPVPNRRLISRTSCSVLSRSLA